MHLEGATKKLYFYHLLIKGKVCVCHGGKVGQYGFLYTGSVKCIISPLSLAGF